MQTGCKATSRHAPSNLAVYVYIYIYIWVKAARLKVQWGCKACSTFCYKTIVRWSSISATFYQQLKRKPKALNMHAAFRLKVQNDCTATSKDAPSNLAGSTMQKWVPKRCNEDAKHAQPLGRCTLKHRRHKSLTSPAKPSMAPQRVLNRSWGWSSTHT